MRVVTTCSCTCKLITPNELATFALKSQPGLRITRSVAIASGCSNPAASR